MKVNGQNNTNAINTVNNAQKDIEKKTNINKEVESESSKYALPKDDANGYQPVNWLLTMKT